MRSIELSCLYVIGYADRISEETAPAVVPPIFASRDDSDLVIMPPLTLTDVTVSYQVPGTIGDLERAIRLGKATKLSEPFEAKSHHVLWLDSQATPRYQPVAEVQEILRKLARDELGAARQAISLDDLNLASKHTGTAIAADDRYLQAYEMKAAILRAQDEEGLVPILAEAAGLAGDDETFLRNVERLVAWIQRERRALVVSESLGSPLNYINKRKANVVPLLRRLEAALC